MKTFLSGTIRIRLLKTGTRNICQAPKIVDFQRQNILGWENPPHDKHSFVKLASKQKFTGNKLPYIICSNDISDIVKSLGFNEVINLNQSNSLLQVMSSGLQNKKTMLVSYADTQKPGSNYSRDVQRTAKSLGIPILTLDLHGSLLIRHLLGDNALDLDGPENVYVSLENLFIGAKGGVLFSRNEVKIRNECSHQKAEIEACISHFLQNLTKFSQNAMQSIGGTLYLKGLLDARDIDYEFDGYSVDISADQSFRKSAEETLSFLQDAGFLCAISTNKHDHIRLNVRHDHSTYELKSLVEALSKIKHQNPHANTRMTLMQQDSQRPDTTKAHHMTCRLVGMDTLMTKKMLMSPLSRIPRGSESRAFCFNFTEYQSVIEQEVI